MAISTRKHSFEIPNYNLTGDLLAFLQCRQQYRFNSKGSLPPSAPVQQWFGEFIHGVMEEGFLEWRDNHREFPWDANTVMDLCIKVARRLRAKGLKPNYNTFSERDTPKKKAIEFEANKRAFAALNILGQYLYPLILDNEVKLEGMRDMPGDDELRRAPYYSVTGVADVITSVDPEKNKHNLLLSYLCDNPEVKRMMDSSKKFEILIDYKGMIRPDSNSDDKTWDHHAWQILMYMWLRKLQLEADDKDTPIIAGILLYLNELSPTATNNKDIAKKMESGATDIIGSPEDIRNMKSGQMASLALREDRCIRIIPYDEREIKKALVRFDQVVADIESCVLSEMRDSSNVMMHWCGNKYERNRCIACDIKCFCIDIPDDKKIKPKVP